VVAAGLVAAATLAGCGGATKVSRTDLEHALRARYGLSATQADCAADVLFTRLSAPDLRAVRSADNTAALPKALQQRYTAVLDAVQRQCATPAPSSGSSASHSSP
jgi:hypothetical protein